MPTWHSQGFHTVFSQEHLIPPGSSLAPASQLRCLPPRSEASFPSPPVVPQTVGRRQQVRTGTRPDLPVCSYNWPLAVLEPDLLSFLLLHPAQIDPLLSS